MVTPHEIYVSQADETEGDNSSLHEDVLRLPLRRHSTGSSLSAPESWSNFDAFSPNQIKIHDFSDSVSSHGSTFDTSIISSRNLGVTLKPSARIPSKFQKLAALTPRHQNQQENFSLSGFLKQGTFLEDGSQSDTSSPRSHCLHL